MIIECSKKTPMAVFQVYWNNTLIMTAKGEDIAAISWGKDVLDDLAIATPLLHPTPLPGNGHKGVMATQA